ncbi:hypothetical protein GCM10008903_03660 [Clostridium cadaveris]
MSVFSGNLTIIEILGDVKRYINKLSKVIIIVRTSNIKAPAVFIKTLAISRNIIQSI